MTKSTTKPALLPFSIFSIFLALTLFIAPKIAQAQMGARSVEARSHEAPFLDFLEARSNERSTLCSANYAGRRHICSLYYYQYVGQHCRCRDRNTGIYYDGTVVPQ